MDAVLMKSVRMDEKVMYLFTFESGRVLFKAEGSAFLPFGMGLTICATTTTA